MKKKKRNFINKLFSLLLLGIISITLLGSWTYDPQNDTITSDNLLNFSNKSQTTTNGITYSINNGIITLNGTSTSEVNIICYISNIPQDILLRSDPITYSENVTGLINFTYMTSSNYWYQSGYGIKTFTLRENLTAFRIIISNNTTISNGIVRPMLYNNNILLNNFEPYGKYVNQSTHSHTNEEYDSLYEDYESWRNDYQELSQQYDQLEENFNTLQQNYNDLTSRYSTLTDEYDTLLEQKQELQQQLADLNNELSLLRPYIFNSSDIVVKIGNSTNTGDNFVATSVVSNVSSYFDNYGSFNLESLYTNYSGFGSTYNAICFEVPNYNLMMYNVSFSFTGFPDMLFRLNYQDSVGNNLVVARDLTESYTDIYGFSIVSGLKNSSMWDSSQPIEYCTYSKIVFVGLNTGALNVKNLNFSSSSGYSEGFNQGYNSIKNTTDTIITRLNNQIDSLNSTIDNLHTQITDLQEQLNQPIELNMRNLIWYIAETPFTSFKTIWNVDFLGLNIASFVTGLFSIWIVIFIIRKIFK